MEMRSEILLIQVTRDSKKETEETFKKGNMYRVILEMFVAGSETTFSTLDWCFLFMAEFPEIQKKCQNEIDECFGNKQITYADRGKLTYLDAVLTEAPRHPNVVPLAVQHSTTVATMLMGYQIPKNTVVLPNLYSAHFDPDYWEKPHKFNQDRFLDAGSYLDVAGKLTNSKKEALILFSLGPSQSVGEPLARLVLFLVNTSFLQRFTFERENFMVKHPL